MPGKIYSIENLDCANCAAKVEERIRRISGVEDAKIVFATMQLHITAEDPDALLPAVQAEARRIEPEIRFLPHREHRDHEHHHHHGCGCEHGHHNGNAQKKVQQELTGILAGAGCFVVGLVLLAVCPDIWLHIPVFVLSWLILGWDVLRAAGKGLFRGKVLDENFLMSVATIGAFCIGEFPEAVGVMLFFRVGEYFEHKAVERSRKSIMEAADLRPQTVTRARGEQWEVIPAQEARPGDLLLVRPGDRIPLDGVVVSGNSQIDTAPVTGEPVPVAVAPGSSVISGCVNVAAQLVLRAEKPLEESLVTKILNSVENAAAGKPRIDRFISRFAKVYTPVVVLLAMAVAVIPGLIDGNWSYWVHTALTFLVMSCPCALVLSVPLAFFSGIGTGSRQGILFKDGLTLEALAGVKAVVLDKTGTLTKGDFQVQSVTGGDALLALCAGAESSSTHPIGVSITAAAKEKGLRVCRPEQLEEYAGMGIAATIHGQQVLCGNQKLLEKFKVAIPEIEHPMGVTTVLAAVDGAFAGCIYVSDTVKTGAATAVRQLREKGLTTAILTGDGWENARAVAEKVGITKVYAQLLPQEKLQILQQLRQEHGAAMFVGDGINDAPVLAGADVGAAMGSGADAAIEAADVVFMHADPAAIPKAVAIAGETCRIARQNVIFAVAIKLAVMVLGLMGYASMWAAVFADSGVAMLCVINAIRQLYRKK